MDYLCLTVLLIFIVALPLFRNRLKHINEKNEKLIAENRKYKLLLNRCFSFMNNSRDELNINEMEELLDSIDSLEYRKRKTVKDGNKY